MARIYDRENTYAPPAVAYQKAYDYDSAGNCIYEGWALSGAATSDAAWAIVEKDYDGTNLVSEQWCGGTTAMSYSWDNRAASGVLYS